MENKTSPRIEVRCGVENCSYNKSSICHAKELEVKAMGDKKAYTSDGTCCCTFDNQFK